MSNFNNAEYECLTKDLIGDIFYADGSFRNKVATIRQYGEIIVRKILDMNPDSQVTLGKASVRNQIRCLPNHEYLEQAIDVIRSNGNLSTHTQHRKEVTEDDFKAMLDGMLNMLSYLLITYFEKYGFGKRQDILCSFSLLPPIVRFKVLDYLVKKHPENITIIDKYVLATTKAISATVAYSWVENQRDNLIRTPAITEEAASGLREKYSPELASVIISSAPNMYDLCIQKIKDVSDEIKAKGRKYSDFESALPFYLEYGVLPNEDDESIEFNDIMNFLYLGRKADMESFSSNSQPLILMNVSLPLNYSWA